MINLPAAQFLLATIIASVIGVSGYLLGTTITDAPVRASLEPAGGTKAMGETFTITLKIESSIPVNVFKGIVYFDPQLLSITAISYNTSIADLWAEEPWYSNGAGTVSFTGGTTIPGGFTGEGSLITITFHANTAGEAIIALRDMQVLQHDGLGSEASLATPIDSIFTVKLADSAKDTIYQIEQKESSVLVTSEEKSRDLNNDGSQSLADVSIFMGDLVSQDLRSDLNSDGKVTLKDLSILTQ